MARPKPLPPGRARRRPPASPPADAPVVEPAHLVFDELDPATGASEVIDIDTATPLGAIVLQLTEQVDYLTAFLADQADEQARLRFVFRISMGRDLDMPLPERAPGQTELVLIGTPYADELGRWDLQKNPFRFVWEDPGNRPVPLPKCCVTGDGCAHITADWQYCRLCPGIPDEQREALPEIPDVLPPGEPVEDGA